MKLKPEHIFLLLSHGDTHWEQRSHVFVTITQLKELSESKNDEEVAKLAKELYEIIYRNPPSLLLDEIGLARKLGIDVSRYPEDIVFSKKTGRFSVTWSTNVFKLDHKVRWALLAPPKDNAKVKSWLDGHMIDSERIRQQLQEEGYEI